MAYEYIPKLSLLQPSFDSDGDDRINKGWITSCWLLFTTRNTTTKKNKAVEIKTKKK